MRAVIRAPSKIYRWLQAAELPWREPGKLSFDLSGLKNLGSSIDSFAEDFKVLLPHSARGVPL